MTHTRQFRLRLGSVALVVLALLFAAGQSCLANPSPPPPPSHGRVFGHASGLVAVDVDFATGKVIAVRMAASTGHADLDEAALAMCRRTQYKPYTVRHRTVPVTFNIRGRKL
jgi:TonB family protein